MQGHSCLWKPWLGRSLTFCRTGKGHQLEHRQSGGYGGEKGTGGRSQDKVEKLELGHKPKDWPEASKWSGTKQGPWHVYKRVGGPRKLPKLHSKYQWAGPYECPCITILCGSHPQFQFHSGSRWNPMATHRDQGGHTMKGGKRSQLGGGGMARIGLWWITTWRLRNYGHDQLSKYHKVRGEKQPWSFGSTRSTS